MYTNVMFPTSSIFCNHDEKTSSMARKSMGPVMSANFEDGL